MRTFKGSCLTLLAVVAGLGFGLQASPTWALDPNLSPGEAFRSGYQAYKAGDAETALEALNFAAEKGHPAALWKLGRMYQTGDLVTEDDKRAMELFAKVANEYADGNPKGPDAPFVANAFVKLGGYYQNGIPGEVDADPGRARRYFNYAASYFGDPDAQYALAAMLLAGQGGDKDPRQAARWFKLAATKGHTGAQAELGAMLFEGVGIARRPVEGLMWLSIARLTSPGDPAVQSRHEELFATADDEDREKATALAEDWVSRNVAGLR